MPSPASQHWRVLGDKSVKVNACTQPHCVTLPYLDLLPLAIIFRVRASSLLLTHPLWTREVRCVWTVLRTGGQVTPRRRGFFARHISRDLETLLPRFGSLVQRLSLRIPGLMHNPNPETIHVHCTPPSILRGSRTFLTVDWLVDCCSFHAALCTLLRTQLRCTIVYAKKNHFFFDAVSTSGCIMQPKGTLAMHTQKERRRLGAVQL